MDSQQTVSQTYPANNVQIENDQTALKARLRISYYQKISDIQPGHGICLVRHVENGKVFVRKDMKVYNRGIYEQLLAKPIPGVPRIYELYEENGVLTVIEEYVLGDTLEDLIEQRKIFPIDTVIRIGIAVCNILTALHACNPPIIHRDIKPSNVIVTADGRIVLLDLNAAKFMDSEESEDTRRLGTKGFAAPEQYGFGSSDVRTDIYGLGRLLSTLTEGAATVAAPQQSALKKVYKYKLQELEAIIRKCTQLNPADRYASATALRQDLISLFEEKSALGYRLRSVIPADVRKFFPPGFRTGSPLNMTAATLVYVFVFWTVSIGGKGINNRPLTVTLQIFVLLIFFALVLFSCNYLNIQSRIPLCNSPNRLVRLAGVLLWDFVIFIVLDIVAGLCAELVTGQLF